MTPRNVKTTAVSKADYVIYRNKAKDFYEMAQQASDLDNWTGVGLNAVHCAISSCDALLVFYIGVRSTSDDHMDAVDLLLRIPEISSGGEVSTSKRIVAKKNLIAYECRDFRQSEALEILKLTKRFYRWTLTNLPK